MSNSTKKDKHLFIIWVISSALFLLSIYREFINISTEITILDAVIRSIELLSMVCFFSLSFWGCLRFFRYINEPKDLERLFIHNRFVVPSSFLGICLLIPPYWFVGSLKPSSLGLIGLFLAFLAFIFVLTFSDSIASALMTFEKSSWYYLGDSRLHRILRTTSVPIIAMPVIINVLIQLNHHSVYGFTFFFSIWLMLLFLILFILFGVEIRRSTRSFLRKKTEEEPLSSDALARTVIILGICLFLTLLILSQRKLLIYEYYSEENLPVYQQRIVLFEQGLILLAAYVGLYLGWVTIRILLKTDFFRRKSPWLKALEIGVAVFISMFLSLIILGGDYPAQNRKIDLFYAVLFIGEIVFFKLVSNNVLNPKRNYWIDLYAIILTLFLCSLLFFFAGAILPPTEEPNGESPIEDSEWKTDQKIFIDMAIIQGLVILNIYLIGNPLESKEVYPLILEILKEEENIEKQGELYFLGLVSQFIPKIRWPYAIERIWKFHRSMAEERYNRLEQYYTFYRFLMEYVPPEKLELLEAIQKTIARGTYVGVDFAMNPLLVLPYTFRHYFEGIYDIALVLLCPYLERIARKVVEEKGWRDEMEKEYEKEAGKKKTLEEIAIGFVIQGIQKKSKSLNLLTRAEIKIFAKMPEIRNKYVHAKKEILTISEVDNDLRILIESIGFLLHIDKTTLASS
ncbi:MAG: hypothetical protein ACE5OZ_02105 [Candidatus Heimdallarchaeota archaeon]